MNFETHPDTRHRDAIRRAHCERSKALASAFAWLFGRR